MHLLFLPLLLLLKGVISSVIPSIPLDSNPFLLNKEFLRIILSFFLTEAKIRRVCKLFRVTFDDSCKYYTLSFDNRLKYFFSDESQSPLRLTVPDLIPFQVPFSFLLQGFSTFKDIKVEVDEQSNLDSFIISFLKDFNEVTFFNPSVPNFERFSAQKLLKFYKLVRGLFPTKDFGTEVIPDIKFPIVELLGHAVRGSFSDAQNRELLMEFMEFIPHNFIFETFKTLNLHLSFLLLSTEKAHNFALARDHFIRRPLHYAAYFGDISLMELILNLVGNKHQHLNLVDQKNQKAIHKAAAAGRLKAFMWLYEKGSIVNKAGRCNSPILNAVEHDRYDIVEFILNKTNYDSKGNGSFNMKLIQIAISRNNLEITRLLRKSKKLYFDEDQVDILIRFAYRESNCERKMESILKS